MIKVIPSEDRHHTDSGWLDARWHFSFSDYHDPKNLHWGPLRVFNDDVIRPGGGFGMHPHENMEIVTYVLSGQLKHADDLGHSEVIHPGEVQVMSAGTGIVHSEVNPIDEPVHLNQLWIIPRTRGSKPRYAQARFSTADRTGKLLPIVSDVNQPTTELTIDQDATVYVSSLAAGEVVTHESLPRRHAYLFVTSGSVLVNDHKVSTGDQARMKDETTLRIEAQEQAELILLDLP